MNSLALRRYLSYFVVIAAAVITVGFYAGTLITDTYYKRTVHSLSDTAYLVKNILNAQKVVDYDKFCQSTGTPDIRVTVIATDGTVLGDSQAEVAQLENHASRKEVQQALLGHLGLDTRLSVSVARQLLYLALPVFEHQQEKIILRLSTPLENLDKRLGEINNSLVVAGLIILLLITLVSLLFERRLISTITRILTAARHFGRGELGFYLRIEKPQDMKQIAAALNDMAKKLQKQIEEVTGRRNELLAVLSSMIEAVIVLDCDLKIVELNDAACALAGICAEVIRHKSLLEVFHNSHLDEFARLILSTNTQQEGIINFQGPNPIVLQANGNVIQNTEHGASASRTAVLVVVLNDITKMKQLETMRRDFVANVSHEIKTPITAIKGCLETLSNQQYLETANRRFLDMAVTNTDRLNAIVDDLLSLSRLEQTRDQSVVMERCLLIDILHAAAQVHLALPDGIKLELECPPDLYVQVNPLLLEQAVGNLLDNAVKYSASPEPIRMTAEAQAGEVFIRVADQGRGIPEKDLPRIFERFYRVDKAHSRELGGTGLGLAIVKHIMLAHGGRAEVSSVLGRGSTFTLVLPVLKDG